MTEARMYMVTYDISCPRRWRRVVSALKRVGHRGQLSVFVCRATPERMKRLEEQLKRIMHHRDDRLIVADLGRATEARAAASFRAMNPMAEFVDLGPLIV